MRVPSLVYGTAWKEDETARLTRLALDSGFRGIDTANQRRHYHEAGVGEAVGAVIREGVLTRDELFLQTKYTYLAGQDHRLPYDARAPIAKQVAQSFESSLQHLGVDNLDSYVLHGPALREGLSAVDLEAWGAMEDLQRSGRTRLLGVSNVTHGQLVDLYARASVKPAFVQNRCFTRPRADREVRAFCAQGGILYQGFSLLTADRGLMRHPLVVSIAKRVGAAPEQVVFRFAIESGMIALTGTTSPEHMAQDLRVFDFSLASGEADAIERLVG